MADRVPQIGWIKIHRKLLNSQVYGNPELLKLWLLCLLRANHTKAYVTLEGVTEPIPCRPGEFITGRYALHRDYYQGKPRNKSPKTVWRWLQKLEKMQLLTIKTTNKYSLVCINKWEFYQNTLKDDQQNDQQMSNRRPTDDQQVSTNNNDIKNAKNEREPTLAHLISIFQEKNSTKEEAENFFEYYAMRGWKVDRSGNRITDYNAAVLNWLRRGREFNTSKTPTQENASSYTYTDLSKYE